MSWIAIGLILAATVAPAPASVEGEWRLVEQFYEAGSNNLAPAAPVRLGFGADGPRIWVDGELAASWPAFAGEDGPVPIELVERVAAPEGRGVSAVYRVYPEGGTEFHLDVTESYTLDEAGEQLAGRLEVRFVRHGEARGAYTLHRRFERVR